MKLLRPFFTMLLLLSYGSVSAPQDRKPANPAGIPPNLLVLIHQEIQPGKSSERQKLETALSRACDRLEAPSFWIDLQSLIGSREVVFLGLFDSFEHLQEAHTGWRQFYAAHPDLAQTQGEIDARVSSERAVVAVRRDDLSYLVDDMDLSEARFVRVLEVDLSPGHESDFAEFIKLWREVYSKAKSDKPWVVYRANEGTSSLAFVILLPMSELKENDDLLAETENTQEETEGSGSADPLSQIAREPYASAVSNLYVVSPEMSHVPREFASSDPDFWGKGSEPVIKPQAKPDITPSKKETSFKPSR
jgi:hypothetical protein